MTLTTPIAGNRKDRAPSRPHERRNVRSTVAALNSSSAGSIFKGPGRVIREFALYTLTDTAERDDHCAHIYHKSLLYLVSKALEEEYHPLQWGWQGSPLLGMEKFIRADKEIHDLFSNQSATWILAPNSETQTLKASKSTDHGGFDDDKATVKGTLARIIGSSASGTTPLTFTASASSSKDRRSSLHPAIP